MQLIKKKRKDVFTGQLDWSDHFAGVHLPSDDVYTLNMHNFY